MTEPIRIPAPANSEIRKLPAQDERIETGPVQFGDDWPGVFIRGDNAFWLAGCCDTLLAALPSADDIATIVARSGLEGLRRTLASCDLTGLSHRAAAASSGTPPQPVAWRFRFRASDGWSEWTAVSDQPQARASDNFQIEPLYAAPSGEGVSPIPEGWKLVPIEPTEEMHVAAVRTIQRCRGNADFPPRVWRAMLAAAPVHQPKGTEEGGK